MQFIAIKFDFDFYRKKKFIMSSEQSKNLQKSATHNIGLKLSTLINFLNGKQSPCVTQF